ncbi:phosphatidate cytidylyltransferase [Pilobolus umbonatus]|nr:phosphatidate cytidylyltransferase [Pilobolus umbonatus]
MNKDRSMTESKWEVPRKVFHYAIGFLVLYLYITGTDTAKVCDALILLTSVAATAELLRFNFEWFNVIYCRLLGFLMRPSEVNNKINGALFYLIAISIVYLSWVDPTASLIGKLWGKYTLNYRGKSLAGSLAAAITGVFVTYLFFGVLKEHSECYDRGTSPVSLTVLSLYGGIISALSEGVSNMFGMDDNLLIPVMTALLLWIPLVKLNLGH